MPNLVFPIPDIIDTVDRMVALNVATQLINVLRINKSKLRIQIPGVNDVIPTTGSISTDTDKRNDLYQHDNVIVTYSEEESEDNITTTTATYKPIEPYLLFDEELGIKLSPIHVYTTGRIDFTYTGVDRNILEQFNNNMRRLYYQTAQDFNVEPEYFYFIPNTCLATINSIYEQSLQFDKDEVRDNVATWLYKRLVPAVKPSPDANGVGRVLIKKEVQRGIFATIDPETRVNPEKNEGSYTVTYSINFKYYKPTMLRLEFPIIVRQTLVSESLRPNIEPYEPDFHKTFIEPSDLHIFRQFLNTQEVNRYSSNKYRTFPSFDEWILKPVKDYQVPVFTYLCRISKNDKRSIFSIYNIEDVFDFSPAIFAYMEDVGSAMLGIKNSVIGLTIYYNNFRMDGGLFTYDEGLVVSKEDLDPNLTYRVMLHINRCFHDVGFDLDRFLKHGNAVIDIINTLYPQAKYDGYDFTLNEDGSFKRWLFEEIIERYDRGLGKPLVTQANISVTCSTKQEKK